MYGSASPAWATPSSQAGEFVLQLKLEEDYLNDYQDFEEAHQNIAAFA